MPPPSPDRAAVVAFPGYVVVAAAVDRAWLAANTKDGDFGTPMSPPFLTALEQRLAVSAGNLDAMLMGSPLPGPPPLDLRPIDLPRDDAPVPEPISAAVDATELTAGGETQVLGPGHSSPQGEPTPGPTSRHPAPSVSTVTGLAWSRPARSVSAVSEPAWSGPARSVSAVSGSAVSAPLRAGREMESPGESRLVGSGQRETAVTALAAGRPPVDEGVHPRVERALRYRTDVRVWTSEHGVLILGRGLAGRWETAIEVSAGSRNKGYGRALATAARHLVPDGRPVWGQVAPGNASSLRAFLAAGYVPVGSEVILTPFPPEAPMRHP